MQTQQSQERTVMLCSTMLLWATLTELLAGCQLLHSQLCMAVPLSLSSPAPLLGLTGSMSTAFYRK